MKIRHVNECDEREGEFPRGLALITSSFITFLMRRVFLII